MTQSSWGTRCPASAFPPSLKVSNIKDLTLFSLERCLQGNAGGGFGHRQGEVLPASLEDRGQGGLSQAEAGHQASQQDREGLSADGPR
jgi:hypothetical protein